MRPIGKLGLRLSVVVTTYNNPRALRLVLAGLERQTVTDFEVLIADDGSGPETQEMISSYAKTAPFPVQHIWHTDRGFRKCLISNKAILAAQGDYLIFFDGDCIPPPHCIATHVAAAEYRRYVAGGKIPLNEKLTARLTVSDVSSGYLDRFGLWWVWGIQGDIRTRRRLVTSRIPGARTLLDLNRQKRWHWRGENSSTFAEHIHLVGGFDERLTYGGEDADFGLRLEAMGILCRSIRYRAPLYHLEHDRPYANQQAILDNIAKRDASLAAGVFVTPYGLRQHQPSSAAPDRPISPTNQSH